MGRLFLLFAIVPILEIALLIRIGDSIGTLNTLAIVVVTALIGSYLAKSEGFSVLNRIQTKMASLQAPTDELVDGAIILVCAALLLTPGVATDVVGFLGLIPFTRAPIRKFLKSRFSGRIKSASFPPSNFPPQSKSDFGSSDERDISDFVREKPPSSSLNES